MQHSDVKPNFPLLLSYQGQQEAELIGDQLMLEQLLRQPQYLLPFADRLIDSLGKVYMLNADQQLCCTGLQLGLAEVISLIQQHFFALAQSCVVKIQAPDIGSALLLLADEPSALSQPKDFDLAQQGQNSSKE